MEVTFEARPDDLLREGRLLLLPLRLAAALALLYAFVQVWRIARVDRMWWLDAGERSEYVALCVVILLLMLLLAAAALARVRQQASTLRALAGSGRSTVRMDGEGVHSEMPGRRTSLAWSHVEEVKTTRRRLEFRRRGVALAFVPRRAFISPESEQAFVEQARQWLAQARSKS